MFLAAWTAGALLASLLGGADASQNVFTASDALLGSGPPGQESIFRYTASANDTSFVSTLRLSSIASEEFTELSHPRFPGHGIRVKKSSFCDPTVNVYTGYLDVLQGSKHLFFYFFESRRDPDKDDVMMWINGGPGCSSATGLLMELGPCNINMVNETFSGNGTLWNPHSWNNEANIFFLDQPVGVGFSYSDHNEPVKTTEDAAKDIHAFITIFFETFAQFKGRALHLSGESYGGRFLPVFASEIYDQNRRAQAQGHEIINLQSVIIGNGITDISTLYEGRYAIECGTAALEVPFQAIGTCVRMKKALPRCQGAMQRSCIDVYDEMNCRAAVNFCESELGTALASSGRNRYDISKMCETGYGLCYMEQEVIAQYLSEDGVRAILGVEPHDYFVSCSDEVSYGFSETFDKWAVPTQYHVSNLLDRGVRILIYAGTYDWQCNWVANKLWVDKLEWSGAKEYTSAEWYDWVVGGATAGETKTAGNLTFATVRGAGHMVPHDKPAESLSMISRWLAKKAL